MKRAIIYYSLTGNTKEYAAKIADHINADLFEIKTVKPMPEKFASMIMYGGMLVTFGLKPKVTGIPENIDEYDEIIIGTPIWAGKHSAPMNTVLASEDIRNKSTAVFTLSGGGDNDKCVPKLKQILPNMKQIIGFADKKLEKETENADKLSSFINALNIE